MLILNGEELAKKIDEVTAVAASPGNAHADHYLRGMANGLLLAQSIVHGTEPRYIEADVVRERRVGIGALYVDVHEFHRVFSHPARLTPGLQPADRVTARADWIDEEVGELRDAKNIYDQADAYIDIIYFAVGGLVEMGVDPSELWRIVHGANMAKVFPDGTVKRREDGKIMKPPHWRAPDAAICEEINRQIGADATPLFEHAGGVADEAVQTIAPPEVEAVEAELQRRAERARDDVAQAQGGSLLREPTKAPQGNGAPADPRFKPQGFA